MILEGEEEETIIIAYKINIVTMVYIQPSPSLKLSQQQFQIDSNGHNILMEEDHSKKCDNNNKQYQ